MTTRANILDGLTSQNEQAEFEGRKGFWVQADCVFIEAANAACAIDTYREDLSKARIGCSHNFACSALAARAYMLELNDEQFVRARNKIKL